MQSSQERHHLLLGDHDTDETDQRARSSYSIFPPAVAGYTLLGLLCLAAFYVAFVRHGFGTDSMPIQQEEPDADLANRIRSSMNMSADPCSNFYEYACGGWISNTSLPAGKDLVARSFSALHDRNIHVLHDLLQSANVTDEDHVGVMWQSCMDEDAMEDVGMAPLWEQIQPLSWISDHRDLLAYLGFMERRHRGFLFDVAVEVDRRDPSRHIVTIHQGGLTMADRALYSDANRTMQLTEHLTRLQSIAKLQLSQSDIDVETAIKNVVNLEVQIAEFSKPKEQLRDPIATYNRRTVRNCTDEFGFDFSAYLDNMGLPVTNQSIVNVENPDFLNKMGLLFRSTRLPLLKDVAVLRTMVSMSSFLTRDVRDQHFHFFSTQLRGIKEQPPRWRQCISSVNQLMGGDLALRFVKRIGFSEQDRRLAKSILDSVIAELKTSLQGAPWIGTATQQAAIDKLQKIKVLMGYPDSWLYSYSLKLAVGKFADNVLRCREFLHGTYPELLWYPESSYPLLMDIPTAKAYYEPTFNLLNFPAGILQLPFFTANRSVSLALNYGGIGTLMGHELIHAIDEQGSQYDGDGKLSPWWSPTVTDGFAERAKCLGKQYASIEFEAGLHIDPELTMRENVADNGAVSAVYKAWLKSEDDHAVSESIPGITNRQLFWIAMAQNWCQIQTKEKLISQLSTDPHSPPVARVHVPLMNSMEFAKDFQCPKDSPLNPTDKCSIW